MISAILFMTLKGEMVLSRYYRDDVTKVGVNMFKKQALVNQTTTVQPPVAFVDGCSFLHIREGSMYLVAATRNNANPVMVFQYLYKLVEIFKAYFGPKFDHDSIKKNLPLVYELMDETMDFGYPQTCSVDVLKLFINTGKLLQVNSAEASNLSSQITGAVDWRGQDVVHRKNEVFIDVLESINTLVSSAGKPLSMEVNGRVIMKTHLSGMPECKFGLNDKVVLDNQRESGSDRGGKKKDGKKAVEIDDVSFHRCVRLGNFDVDRSITFIPPDGEFDLMKYRVTDKLNQPFKVIPVIQAEGKSRVTLNIKVRCGIKSNLHANNVTIKVPAPPNVGPKPKLKVGSGRAKYEPTQGCIVWKVKKWGGGVEHLLTGELELVAATKDKVWSKPPIIMDFTIPMFTASGFQVRFLKVHEKKLGYQATKWVRYISKAGDYQVRV